MAQGLVATTLLCAVGFMVCGLASARGNAWEGVCIVLVFVMLASMFGALGLVAAMYIKFRSELVKHGGRPPLSDEEFAAMLPNPAEVDSELVGRIRALAALIFDPSAATDSIRKTASMRIFIGSTWLLSLASAFVPDWKSLWDSRTKRSTRGWQDANSPPSETSSWSRHPLPASRKREFRRQIRSDRTPSGIALWTDSQRPTGGFDRILRNRVDDELEFIGSAGPSSARSSRVPRPHG